MNALVCSKPGQFEYIKSAAPIAQPGKTLLRIKRVGICGTDLHAFEGTQPFFSYPRILGHELAAEIIQTDAAGFSVGDLVTIIPYFNCGNCIACNNNKPNCCTQIQVFGVHINGAMQEMVSVPSYSLVPTHGLALDAIALVEPLAIGAHGVNRAGVKPGEFVLVVGAGPIGLGAMEMARMAGAKVIAPADPYVFADVVETEFLRAEAAERGFTVAGSAESHYNKAITASILYWGGTQADADAYLAQPAVAYSTAAGNWKQKIGTQKWIALYNRPYEGWTELRRLDFPVIAAPVNAKSGFPTRLTYPANEQTLNGPNYTAAASAIGGDLLTTKLFWDKN